MLTTLCVLGSHLLEFFCNFLRLLLNKVLVCTVKCMAKCASHYKKNISNFLLPSQESHLPYVAYKIISTRITQKRSFSSQPNSRVVTCRNLVVHMRMFACNMKLVTLTDNYQPAMYNNRTFVYIFSFLSNMYFLY